MTSSHSSSARFGILSCLRAKALFVLSSTAVIAALLAPAATASADETASSSGGALEEVVVTARRKQENLQEVPLSVSVITSADLKASSATSLEDVTSLTPGLTYSSNGAQADAAPTIRGLSDTSGGEATSQNVSIFLDGVYIANPSAIDLSLGGLERVEVVKGPVSGLYGRNAFTGAINYVTSKPSDEYHADLAETVGDYGRQITEVSGSGALIPGLLSARVSGTYDHLDGTYKDDASGQNGNGHSKHDLLVTLRYTPNSHIEVTPVFYFGQDSFTAPATVIYKQNCALGTSNSYCGSLNDNQMGPYLAPSDESGATGLTRRVNHAHIDANFDYEWGTADILYGYNGIHTESINEFTGTENGLVYGLYAPGANNPFAGNPTIGSATLRSYFGDQAAENDNSVELRYDTPKQYPLRFSIGGYYYYHTFGNNNTFGIDGEAIPPGDVLNFIAQGYVTPHGQSKSPINESEGITRDYSGFISGDWDIVSGLTLSGAVRQTDEQQKLSISHAPYLEATFPSTTSNSSLTWKPTKDLTLYVSAANGEKSGGFNGGAEGPADLTFEPETDWSYEFGVKPTFLDGRLPITFDVFYTKLNKLQVVGPPSTAGAVALVVKNFGEVTAKGVELEGHYLIAKGTTIAAGFAYSDPKFASGSLDFNDGTACALIASCASSRLVTVKGNQAVNLTGLSPPIESNITFNTSLNYRNAVGFRDFDWFARADYRYESKQYNTVTNFAFYGPRNIVNLHLGLTNDVWTATAFVLNATNDRTPINNVFNGELNGFDPPPIGDFGVTWIPTSVLPDGRTFGLRIAYHY